MKKLLSVLFFSLFLVPSVSFAHTWNAHQEYGNRVRYNPHFSRVDVWRHRVRYRHLRDHHIRCHHFGRHHFRDHRFWHQRGYR
jgi:hypothetical protein